MAKRKTEQAEFGGMPDRDEVGKAALVYLAKRDALETAKEELDRAAGDLIGALTLAKRESVSCNGKTLTLKHVMKDAITVRTSREK